MSTYYYAVINECKCCGRSDRVKIGLSAIGWAFIFKVGDIEDKTVRDFDHWLEFVKSADRIEDEYHHTQSLQEFLAFIENKKDLKKPDESRGYWTDRYGNAFSDT